MHKIHNRQLCHYHIAHVELLNEEKMKQFAQLVNQEEPSITNVIGFMEGVPLAQECTINHILQNDLSHRWSKCIK